MLKILVVENELSIQRLVEANLTARGYQVLVAPDGEEGLKLAELECPDLILLDLMMPDMSGWDVLTVLKTKQELQKTPVIIMTALAGKAEEDKARGMGVGGYLVKPFGVDELMSQVELAIGK